jgi:hypothetical protein
VRDATVWRRASGVDQATVTDKISYDEVDDVFIARVRHRRSARLRCGLCSALAPGYDQGEGPRRWRTLDIGVTRCVLEGNAPRVNCAAHGVTVARVVWARHDARHTRAFDDQVAWLQVHTSKTAVTMVMRIAWVTVGAIAPRIVADVRASIDPFDGLRRIGIDEISYKRGHKYLTVVVDHDTGRLLWAQPGRDMVTLGKFFDELGEDRSALITLVSADAAEWIATVVAERCPNATLCADPMLLLLSSGGWDGFGCGEQAVDVASDVTLEAAHCSWAGLAFADALVDVGAGLGVPAEPDHDDPPQRHVGVAVPSAVQPMPVLLARGAVQRRHAAERGEGCLAAQPVRVVAGGDHESSGDVGADTLEREQSRGRCVGHDCLEQAGEVCRFGVECLAPSGQAEDCGCVAGLVADLAGIGVQ